MPAKKNKRVYHAAHDKDYGYEYPEGWRAANNPGKFRSTVPTLCGLRKSIADVGALTNSDLRFHDRVTCGRCKAELDKVVAKRKGLG